MLKPRPVLTGVYRAYGGVPNAVHPSNLMLITTSSTQRAYLYNLLRRQLTIAESRPATFLYPVLGVIPITTKEQMSRVTTRWIVAVMQYIKWRRIDTMAQIIRHTVSQISESADPKLTVAFSFPTFPWPTLLWPTAVYGRPESVYIFLLKYWYWLTIMIGHVDPSYGSSCLKREAFARLPLLYFSTPGVA